MAASCTRTSSEEAPDLHIKQITKALMVEGQDAIEENDICSFDGNEVGQPAA